MTNDLMRNYFCSWSPRRRRRWACSITRCVWSLLFDAAVGLLSEAALPGLSLSLSFPSRSSRHHYWSLPGGAEQTSAPWSQGWCLPLSLPEEEERTTTTSRTTTSWTFLLGLVSDSPLSTGFNPSPSSYYWALWANREWSREGCARGRGAPPGLAGRCAAP